METAEMLQLWHHIVFEKDLGSLSLVLADDVAFHSPFVWRPYEGRIPTFIILSTVIDVFEDFHYHRELIDGATWALEFSARVGNLSLKGIDLISFNNEGKIATFEVFIRPANALLALGQEMQKRLAEKGL